MRQLSWLAALLGVLAWTPAYANDTAQKTADAAESAGQDVKQGTEHAATKTKEAGRDVTDDARKASSGAIDTTKQTGSDISNGAQEAGRDARDRAQHASSDLKGEKSVSGEVKSISGDKLTVENPRGEKRELELSSDTKIMRDGQSISRSDLQEGAQIRASFSGSADDLKASRIEVLRQGERSGTSDSMKSDSTSTDHSKDHSSDKSDKMK